MAFSLFRFAGYVSRRPSLECAVDLVKEVTVGLPRPRRHDVRRKSKSGIIGGSGPPASRCERSTAIVIRAWAPVGEHTADLASEMLLSREDQDESDRQ